MRKNTWAMGDIDNGWVQKQEYISNNNNKKVHDKKELSTTLVLAMSAKMSTVKTRRTNHQSAKWRENEES